MTALARHGGGWLAAPQNMNEVWRFAENIAKTDFVPRDLRNNPGAILAAIQYGGEIGLAPMQALQSVMVVNGRPSLWGDAIEALILNHPELKEFKKTYDEKTRTATCRIVREHANGLRREIEESFSWADAVTAKLTEKDLYKLYPKRMLSARARGFAVREAFSDVLKGIITREEAMDIPGTIEVKGELVQEPETKQQPEAPLPTRTSKNYPDKQYADTPFESLPYTALIAYHKHYTDRLPTIEQPNHNRGVKRTIAAVEAMIEQRRREEAAAAGADEETGEVPAEPDDFRLEAPEVA